MPSYLYYGWYWSFIEIESTASSVWTNLLQHKKVTCPKYISTTVGMSIAQIIWIWRVWVQIPKKHVTYSCRDVLLPPP
eukprot:UN04302